MNRLVAFLSGSLFAVGLSIGGMTRPEKIVDFLDLAGEWDPSLALVMGGALVVYTAAYQWIHRNDEPIAHHTFHIPDRHDVDWRLITGSALFGVGWGVGGYCPGPALTALVASKTAVFAVVGGIVGGIFLHTGFDRLTDPSSASSEGAEVGG